RVFRKSNSPCPCRALLRMSQRAGEKSKRRSASRHARGRVERRRIRAGFGGGKTGGKLDREGCSAARQRPCDAAEGGTLGGANRRFRRVGENGRARSAHGRSAGEK